MVITVKNYWWVTRPKRKLNSIPEVLSTFAELSLNQQWTGQRASHLSLEDALEKAGLKRKGERRDQGGGGARTYGAWLASLGLIFTQESTKQIKLTLAGEAIINGDSPVEVLKWQVLKYQFPSSFSIGRNVNVSPRFKIHPFMFLLKLLSDDRIKSLSQNEIANIIIVEAENETDRCYEYIVKRILDYRNYGNSVLPANFNEIYGVATNSTNLQDVANTMMNWLDYTQLTFRDDGRTYIVPERAAEVAKILAHPLPFIDRCGSHEFFQRKYGIDPKHNKDTRNLSDTKTITAKMIAEQQIIKAYIGLSLQKPITKINSAVIDYIVATTGLNEPLVIETLQRKYPKGSIGSFMTQYYEMAFKGRDEATEFEKATVELFQDVFNYQAKHVGPIGLTPDVLVLSDADGYAGIIDNKAYSKYTISNDHHNRMVHNYIRGFNNYYNGDLPLAFFTYIAGGFGSRINSQIKGIVDETGIHGSVINVHNMIELVQKYDPAIYTHADLRKLFTVDRQIVTADFIQQ
mgnify:CR=1 FL=1